MDMDHNNGSMGMDDGGTMGGMSPASQDMMGMGGMGMTHMTFYWGKDAWILIEGFPGTSTGLYSLALLLIFLLALMVEWLAHSNVIPTKNNRLAGTMIHVMRVVFSYVLMLAVMSFNIGVFVVAVVGHAIGYYLFHDEIKRDTDMAPLAC